MLATLILWSHALAALLFGALALNEFARARPGLPRRAYVAALALTGLWALALAGLGARDIAGEITQGLRALGWLGFMLALVRRDGQRRGAAMAVLGLYAIVAVLIVIGTVLGMAAAAAATQADMVALGSVKAVLAMMAAMTALVLVHQLYDALAGRAGGGVRLAIIALAALWASDLGVAGWTYLGGATDWPVLMRGFATLLLAPVFALAVVRDGDWTLRVSRTVTYQSLVVAGGVFYLGSMALAIRAIAAIGGNAAPLWQTAFILGSTTALVTFASTPWLKAWLKVKLAKHLFTHRYDYRAEWLRFSDTLGQPGDRAAPLEQRIVSAVADLTCSAAGLLLVPDGSGLGQGAAWNWPEPDPLTPTATAALAAYLAETGRIVELDAVRDGTADAAELAAIPQSLTDRADAWVLVPLIHRDQLAGAVVLARPPVDRRPDWEDFDLLRLAGRQVASYLAEARAQQALGEAQRFEEFNRRFAFILHDLKNLVSQLTLVARNAERHADNPDFRADMIATLQDSAARMNGLLARLSQHHGTRGEAVGAVAAKQVIDDAARRRRAQHPIVTRGDADTLVLADEARLAQLLDHLIQNAIEASPPTEPVMIALSSTPQEVSIDVIDRGSGMSPAFVRDQLFKPFVSSKPNGFGLGAFEARQLAEAMGGSVCVASREGEGTRFRVTLPRATPHHLGKAA